MLFDQGRNIVQVSRWLGHGSADFTLRTYVHLIDGNVGEPRAVPSGCLQNACTEVDEHPALAGDAVEIPANTT